MQNDMMNDPYAVLGVSRSDSDEDIKKAYHALARKYHPDKYTGTDLAEIANEKMQKVNAAYEAIKRERAAGAQEVNYGQPSYGPAYESAQYDSDEEDEEESDERYINIRSLINENRFYEAERILLSFEEEERGAEWYFLQGCIYYRNGNTYDAGRCFDIAVSRAPYKQEYRDARDRIREQSTFSGTYPNDGENDQPEQYCCCTDDFCVRCCTIRLCCFPCC